MQVKVSNAAPAVAFDRPGTTADKMGALVTAFAHHTDGSGVFEKGQNPITVGQAAYNSAYGTNFAGSGWCSAPSNPSAKCDGYARISEQGGDLFKFDTLAGPQLAIPLEPKGIHDEMNSANFDEFGRMTANIGLEAPGATPLLQNIILYPYVNPATEILDSTNMPSSMDVTPISSAADGTQIWKITHNGVDTHPIHFHLYDIQLLNRVAWDNIISPPDPNELGWKDTVRVNPLQDTYVAIRPIVPVLPFAIPDSIRPLNPMMPLGARGTQAGQNGQEAGFNNTGPTGAPIDPIVNEMTNFFWEYVWHCHILSHEEMDMMRPVSVYVPRELPDAPVLTFTRGSVILNWTDGTPVSYSDLTTWGNPKNEIGFRIERAVIGNNGQPGAFQVLTTVLANTTTYTDLTPITGQGFSYRVIAFNAALGESTSNEIVVSAPPPADPTNLVASAVSATSVGLTWTDNANNELGYYITNFGQIDGVAANISAYTDPTAQPNTTYSYRVIAYNLGGNSVPSNIATVTTPAPPVVGPTAPTNLAATLLFNPTRAQLSWRDNSNNENLFQVWRSVNGGAFTQIGTVNRSNNQRTSTGGTVTFTNFNLTNGSTYQYYVIAVNTAPNPDQSSAPSNTVSVTVTAPTIPAAPTSLAGSAVRLPNGNPNRPTQDMATLTWTDNAGNETGFQIQRSTSPNFNNASTYTVGANVTTFSQNVSRTQNFYYRVRATNAAGNSAWSNVVFVTTP
jgi:hypothetical protein